MKEKGITFLSQHRPVIAYPQFTFDHLVGLPLSEAYLLTTYLSPSPLALLLWPGDFGTAMQWEKRSGWDTLKDIY